MLIKKPKASDVASSEITPQSVYMRRREFLQSAAMAGAAVALGPYTIGNAHAGAKLPNVAKTKWTQESLGEGDKLTPYEDVTSYNNFYEFGSHKRIAMEARKLKVRPWTVSFEGMVEKERQVDIDTLIRAMPIEERLYRMRCVEAWSMAVPWSGFALAELVKYARPLSSAKYLVMQTFHDKKMASGQKQVWYPWPYTEGLTMAEATNELAFMVTGVYGKPLPKQFGAPLRLAAPWKYGFKSVKSIVRFEFTDKRPVTFWEQIQAAEYGFWANVNPKVSHPRWSQASERVLGTTKRVPTLLYNGYGEQVAHMYKDLKGEKLFM